MRRKGFFICIEGLDKSGKTTQSLLLVKTLRRKGFNAVYTTEPSDSDIGEFIRRYVLNREKRLPVAVEALLFAADRAYHTERKIKPALKEGKIVVSDRYVYSSLAYQGAAGLDIRWIMEINKFAIDPDLAIYINVPVEVILQRCERKKSVMEQLEIQRRVLEVYMSLIREGKMIPINGDRPIEEIAEDIKKIVLERLDIKAHGDN